MSGYPEILASSVGSKNAKNKMVLKLATRKDGQIIETRFWNWEISDSLFGLVGLVDMLSPYAHWWITQ